MILVCWLAMSISHIYPMISRICCMQLDHFFLHLTVCKYFWSCCGRRCIWPLVSRIPDVLITVQIPYFPFLSRLHFYVWLLPEFILLADSFLCPTLDFFVYCLWVLPSTFPSHHPSFLPLLSVYSSCITQSHSNQKSWLQPGLSSC